MDVPHIRISSPMAVGPLFVVFVTTKKSIDRVLQQNSDIASSNQINSGFNGKLSSGFVCNCLVTPKDKTHWNFTLSKTKYRKQIIVVSFVISAIPCLASQKNDPYAFCTSTSYSSGNWENNPAKPPALGARSSGVCGLNVAVKTNGSLHLFAVAWCSILVWIDMMPIDFHIGTSTFGVRATPTEVTLPRKSSQVKGSDMKQTETHAMRPMTVTEVCFGSAQKNKCDCSHHLSHQ